MFHAGDTTVDAGGIAHDTLPGRTSETSRSPPLKAPPRHAWTIEPPQARRILLSAQALSAPPRRHAGPAAVRRLIEDLGFVQVDSINVIERAHHLIMHARLEGYRPSSLKGLLENRRRLFEHWTHDASLIPIEFYAHWKPRFAAYAARPIEDSWWGKRLGGEDAPSLLRRVLREVRVRGPIRGRDLAPARREDGTWWNWHPGKAALEHLWRTGRLAIEGRDGFEKRYDLAARVHPDAHRARRPTRSAHVDWACRSAIDRLGVATPGEIAAFWKTISPQDARDWCRVATASEEVEPVALVDLQGRRQDAVATSRARRWARVEPWSDECRLLCPFDPVIRDRTRLHRRFGFEFRFEAFVPASRRRYGYYVMPILHGDRFIGRIDPRFDRDASRLEIRGPWWESGAGGPADRRRLDRALDRLAERLGASRGWRYVRTSPTSQAAPSRPDP